MKKLLEQIKKWVTDVKAGKDMPSDADLAAAIKLTPEDVTEFLTTEEGKKVLLPLIDKDVTRGIETYKTKTVPRLITEAVEAEIKKRYPEETEEQKRLKRLEADYESEKRARIRETLRNKAISTFTEKGLPVKLADYFLGENEEAMTANLGVLETVWASALKDAVEKKFKDNRRDVHQTTIDPKDLDAQIAAAEQKGDWNAAIALKMQKAAKQQ